VQLRIRRLPLPRPPPGHDLRPRRPDLPLRPGPALPRRRLRHRCRPPLQPPPNRRSTVPPPGT